VLLLVIVFYYYLKTLEEFHHFGSGMGPDLLNMDKSLISW
jgi:hypothetical protein